MKTTIKRLTALFLALLTLSSVFALSASAYDGGHGGLEITSHEDGDVIDRTADSIKLKWTKPAGTDHFHITIMNMTDGSKPLDKDIKKNYIKIDPSDYFTEDGQYKIYVAAYARGKHGIYTLNSGSCWMAIYVRAEASGPKLAYASPSLTSPKVEVKYDSDTECYYGIYDGEIAPNKNLTLRWTDVEADHSILNAIILKGEPDIGSSREERVHEILLSKKRTSCKYTISKKDLQGYEGKYLKLAIQPMGDDGDYGIISMFYLKIAGGEEETPPVVEESNTPEESDTPTVFLQHKGEWATYAYGHSDHDCKNTTNIANAGCGLLSMTNAVFALNGNFIDPTFIADYALKHGYRVCGDGTSPELYAPFANNYGTTYAFAYDGKYESNIFANLKKKLESGCVAIANMPGHFYCIAKYDSGKYLVLDSYPSGNRGTTANGDWKTEEQLKTDNLWVRYFVAIKKAATISAPSAEAKAGSKIEIPIRLDTNPGLSSVTVKVNTDLEYSIRNGDVFKKANGMKFSSTDNVYTTGNIAILSIEVPKMAKKGDEYSVTVTLEGSDSAGRTVQFNEADCEITVIKATIQGDVNSDGRVNSSDLALLIKYITFGQGAAEIDLAAADLNDDSCIDMDDLVLLLRSLKN